MSENRFAQVALGSSALPTEGLLLQGPRPAVSASVHDLPGKLTAILAKAWVRYAIAFMLTGIALVGRWKLVPVLGDHVPFALVYGAVVLSALYLGLGPSIAASVMGVVGVRFFFTPHSFFLISNMKEFSETCTYLGGCALIVCATEATRRSRNKLKMANCELALRAEALRTFSERLEQRVRERTVELKRAEESARRLGAQVLRMQDEERRRIARDLHDGIGQSAAILGMNLGQLGRSAGLTKRESEIVSESKATAKEIVNEVRTLSYLLHPPLLDEMGLPSALKWYVRGFSERSGIATSLNISECFRRLPADFEIAIFRIVQEALTNIHRHSGSASATVSVASTASEVEVEIADKGNGISKDKQRIFAAGGTMGVGLRGMRERVNQLGGRLDLRSNDDGTSVKAILPVCATAEELVDTACASA